MLSTVMASMVALVIAAIVNILMGVYNNVNVENCKFDFHKLLNGIIKAIVIIVSFVGIAYCFDVTDLSSIGVTPDLVVNAAIVLYIGKALQNIIKILGITQIVNKTITTTEDNIDTTNTDDANNTSTTQVDDSMQIEGAEIISDTPDKTQNNFEDSVG